MPAKFRAALLSFVTILVLLISLAAPAIARADDGAPPPESNSEAEVTTEETPPSETSEEAVESVSVPEILEAAPEGTEIVVLDEQGEVLPLASEAAAEVLVSGDPMWCPEVAGLQTLPGDPGCTGSFTGFNPNINDGGLLAELSGGSYSGNGTIYVAHNYDSSLDGSD